MLTYGSANKYRPLNGSNKSGASTHVTSGRKSRSL